MIFLKQALLVIDIQNDYFKDGKMELVAPEQALKQINKLETHFSERKEPIIYIQHINYKPNPIFFENGTSGADLHQQLHMNSSSIIVEKQYPNSFFQTTLQETLASLQVEQLVITGMMTHMCVDSTTRASKELGYNPILISDATATKDLTFDNRTVQAKDVQASYLAALQNFAGVISTEEYLK